MQFKFTNKHHELFVKIIFAVCLTSSSWYFFNLFSVFILPEPLPWNRWDNCLNAWINRNKKYNTLVNLETRRKLISIQAESTENSFETIKRCYTCQKKFIFYFLRFLMSKPVKAYMSMWFHTIVVTTSWITFSTCGYHHWTMLV